MSGDATVVKISDEPTALDAQAVARLATRVEEAVTAGAARVVIDASNLRSVQRDGVAALLSWASGLREAGAPRPALAGAPRPLLLAVIQTRMQRELDVYVDSEAALRDLGGV